MLNVSDYQEIVKRAVGQKAIEAKYLIYSFGDHCSKIIAVSVAFPNGDSLAVQCASDGDSIIVNPEDFEEADLADAGCIGVVDAHDFDPISLLPCVDTLVERITLEVKDSTIKSISIEFEKGLIFISNIGDVLDFDEVRFRQNMIEEGLGPFTSVSFSIE